MVWNIIAHVIVGLTIAFVLIPSVISYFSSTDSYIESVKMSGIIVSLFGALFVIMAAFYQVFSGV